MSFGEWLRDQIDSRVERLSKIAETYIDDDCVPRDESYQAIRAHFKYIHHMDEEELLSLWIAHKIYLEEEGDENDE
jgi:hypothetical protein